MIRRKIFVEIAIILLVIFLLPTNSNHIYFHKDISVGINNTTLYVGGSGANNYSKIQDAIDDASDGDTIIVYFGIYKENLNIDKSLTIIGINKPLIDGHISVSKNIKFKNFKLKRMHINSSLNILENLLPLNNETFFIIYFINSSYNEIYNCTVCDKQEDDKYYWGMYFENSLNNELYNVSGNFVIQHSSINIEYSKINCLSSIDSYVNITYCKTHSISAYYSFFHMQNIFHNDRKIFLRSCEVKITNSSIIESEGIYIHDTSCFIYRSNIINNTVGVFTNKGCKIRYCNIYGNKDIGVFAGRIVDARYNYWGSVLGPSYGVKIFRGDLIAPPLNVKHFPWLLFPVE
ncbi:MAG TPA: hypothetical protein ENI52_02670 [Thermoplasmata archaeon]|nr:hypothetical protein [Thermoplasmata archaeon]